MTSPPFIVPIARQVARSIESLTNRTDPSPIRHWTPPVCRLDGGTCIAMFDMFPGKPMPAQVSVFGTSMWLYVVQHISPITQLAPCLLVSGVKVAGFTALHELYVSAEVFVFGIENMSVRGFGAPEPRSFSLNSTVLLNPSVRSANFTLLR